MLKIQVLLEESFDEIKQEFVEKTFELELEHSLSSLSKWESEFEKPYFREGERTDEETLGYIRAMIMTPVFPPDIIDRLSKENVDRISEYINAKMSATWFTEEKIPRGNRETITSELIYFWMTSYRIPWEAQHWHLNRLLTLIRVFNTKNIDTKKKTPTKDSLAERRALNEQRRAQYKTNG